MILIADGGSTKVDWIALDENKNQLFKVRTPGLNPAVVEEKVLKERVLSAKEFSENLDKVTQIFFYGAGCGTVVATKILKDLFEDLFPNAEVVVEEDMLAAVYAATGSDPAIVCILGTGSNSCYYDGEKTHMNTVSLGYMLMDEASGNYFGKRLIRNYYYKTMPDHIAKKFEESYDLSPDTIKHHLYKEPNPNTYLADFASFMFQFKEEQYVKDLMESGFDEFFISRVLPFKKDKSTPIYFIGSIAHYFYDILEKVAGKYELNLAGAIQRPIDNLIKYHKEFLIK
ncbi:BadF/BadG/BcrA/BcrD ATPase family protein [Flavicella sp.]|uniref:BadF/BadG/BcrA/BcrD ATPase family protein n=1 Tax=Flavicella sp. TaxID=2957742 RepID=UPI0026099D9C|nr:BadF/BadG/BcrA/BcrD ATPase family protein [Flavicella sp.]MDG1804497.1 N-acetylglucosamine kinase [Flavicella sp.]MDG2281111.1 N-acetylglucosamine kinase [Flavicella sp.]